MYKYIDIYIYIYKYILILYLSSFIRSFICNHLQKKYIYIYIYLYLFIYISLSIYVYIILYIYISPHKFLQALRDPISPPASGPGSALKTAPMGLGLGGPPLPEPRRSVPTDKS